jgi:hypothetical protein
MNMDPSSYLPLVVVAAAVLEQGLGQEDRKETFSGIPPLQYQSDLSQACTHHGPVMFRFTTSGPCTPGCLLLPPLTGVTLNILRL